MEARPELEALLTHADWLARLARRLVTDAAAAEDLVQETWIAALRRPPDPDRPARPWLAGIARRLALVRRRRESRQVASSMPSADAALSAEETAMQVELQRTVADAVLALEEPFRGAVLLRYYRGLTSVEIARALDVPEATVRTRIKRGLERLRLRLDQVHGGDGRRWIRALAPLVGLDRSVPVAGTVLIGGGIVTKWVVGVVAVVVAIVWTRSSWERAAPPAPPPQATVVDAREPVREAADTLEVTDDETSRVAVVEPAADPSEASNAILPGANFGAGEAAPERTGALIGRIVDTQEPPHSFAWHVSAANSEPSVPGGERKGYAKVAADPSTGEFRFDALPAGPVLLQASAAGLQVIGPWIEVRPDAITEATIYFRAPDAERQIHVTTFTYPFGEFLPEPSTIRLERGGTNLAVAEHDGGHRPSFVFRGLDPGSYDVFIEDERFEPWSQSGVHPGENIVARLEGNAAVILDVRDAATDERRPALRLDLVYLPREGEQLRDANITARAGRDPPRGRLLRRLVPHDCKLVVSAEKHGATELSWSALPRENGESCLSAGRRYDAGGSTCSVPPAARRGRACRSSIPARSLWPISAVSSSVAGSSERAAGATGTRERSLRKLRLRAPRIRNLDPLRQRQCHRRRERNRDALRRGARGSRAAFSLRRFPRGSRAALREHDQPEKLELAVLPANRESTRLYLPRSGGPIEVVRSEIGPAGEFRLGPLGAGELIVRRSAAVGSFPAGYTGRTHSPGEVIQLERLRVDGGDALEREYDLRTATGSLLVDARVNGAPASKTVVELSTTSGGSPSAGAVLTDDGTATCIRNLFPGEWRMVLRDIEGRWRYGHRRSGSSAARKRT